MKVEACTSRAALRADCETCRAIITGMPGKTRAQAFCSKTKRLLTQVTAPGTIDTCLRRTNRGL